MSSAAGVLRTLPAGADARASSGAAAGSAAIVSLHPRELCNTARTMSKKKGNSPSSGLAHSSITGISPATFLDILGQYGVRVRSLCAPRADHTAQFFAGVPDSLLAELCALLETLPREVPAARATARPLRHH